MFCEIKLYIVKTKMKNSCMSSEVFFTDADGIVLLKIYAFSANPGFQKKVLVYITIKSFAFMYKYL